MRTTGFGWSRSTHPGDEEGRGPLDPRPLVALTIAVLVASLLDVVEPWPGIVHLVALTPLGTVADVRYLLVHAAGWPWFLAGLAASVALRSVLLAATLRSLDGHGLRLAVGYHLAILPGAVLAGVLLYAGQALLFYVLFWAGVAVAAALLVGAGAVPWTRAGDGERRPRSGSKVQRVLARTRPGTVGAYLALLTVLSGLATVAGPLAELTAVPVSAALTFAALQVLHRRDLLRRTRRVLALAPVVGVGVVAWASWAGPAAPEWRGDAGVGREGSLLLRSGIDSSSGRGAALEIDPRTLGWSCRAVHYYSYAGPGDGQPDGDAVCSVRRGAPYGPEDTLRPRDEQVGFLEEQVAGMAEPVTVMAHSQGVWILWDALAAGRLDGVETIVLVGGFAENPVSYPAASAGGPGTVGRFWLGALVRIPRPGGTTVFVPDSPLGREWLARPEAVSDVFARPLPPEVQVLSLTSSFDLPLAQRSATIDGSVASCPVPVVHPNLPYSAELHARMGALLDGRAQPACPWWRHLTGPAFRQYGPPPSRPRE